MEWEFDGIVVAKSFLSSVWAGPTDGCLYNSLRRSQICLAVIFSTTRLDLDQSDTAEGNSTHGCFIIAVPSFGIGCRTCLTNSPPGAGRLQVCTHGDVPLAVVGTGEDSSHGGERGGRHCESVSCRRSSASECESSEEEKHSALVKALVNPSLVF